MRTAPWTDFNGHEILEGDVLRHPSNQTGLVVYHLSQTEELDQWQVEYTDGVVERLYDQIGIKGQAEVVQTTAQN